MDSGTSILQRFENLRVGSLVRHIFETCNIANDVAKHVRGIEYLSRPGVHLALILESEQDYDFIKSLQNSNYIRSCERVRRFVNIEFYSIIQELYFQTPMNIQQNTQQVIIEHTSLVPVYPLNLATFRLSVVGEWFRRALMFLGNDVHAHFWVQDSARQVDLVKTQLRNGGYTSTKTAFGKGDHTIGRVFAEALLIEDGVSRSKARASAAQLFPLGASGVRRPNYGNWISDVIAGWRSTYNAAGIHIDQFDRDADLLDLRDQSSVLEAARHAPNVDIALPLGKFGTESLSYLEWSVLYYCYLLQSSERVISVASARQKAILESARDYACFVRSRPKEALKIVSVGDVFCEGELDSVRGGRFHLVDNLSFYSQRNVHWLTTRFLTARPTTNLRLRFPIEERGKADVVDWQETDPVVFSCMLLDSLPLIVQDCVSDGDFAPLTKWAADARSCRSRLQIGEATLSRDLAAACDTFDPFPS